MNLPPRPQGERGLHCTLAKWGEIGGGNLSAVSGGAAKNSAMSPSLAANDAFDRAVAPVISLLSRDQAAKIADFHADEALQLKIEELARKANEGELTCEERAEYEGYAQANRFLAVFQAQARRKIAEERGRS